MAKNKKQETPNPEEQAAEDRVRQMMEPETPATRALAAKKPISISVTHHDEADETTAAIEEANEQLRATTAPEVSKEATPIKIEVIPDTEESAPEEPEAVEEEPEIAETLAEEAETEEVPDEPPTEIEEPEVPEVEDVPPVVVDTETEKAVDEIQAEESDRILQTEDFEREIIAAAGEPENSFRAKLGRFFGSRILHWALLLIIIAGITAVGVYPKSRYIVLNKTGVRSSASMIILDDSTGQPLKNVSVKLAGQTGITDTEGKVTLSQLMLGEADLVVEKRAFAPLTRKYVVGWGSNPLGDFKLQPVGTQYAFMVTDFLSGKPIEKVEITSKEASALSNEKGEVKLTTDKIDDASMDVTIHADGYRDEKLTVGANDTAEKGIKLVSARKHVFVSKRSGKLDVYKVDIDGKNEERILAGTGTERDDMIIVSHPTAEIVAVVSSRENKRNKDGFLLSTLSIIDLKNNEVKAVTTSERLQIVDWVGSRLVYVQVADGESAASPKRHRLMSYQYEDKTNKEIAASNFFNDVVIAGNKIYYAPSSAYQDGGELGFFKINADGSDKTTITSEETWNIFRSTYDHLTLAMPKTWYDYHLGDKAANKLEGAPANQVTHVYADSPDGKRSLWVDTRDGKGVLLYFDTTAKTDTVVKTQSGLKNPIRWLDNNSLVFRITTDQETADYALSLDGGEAIKIRDVTDTGGVDRWYYY